MATNRPQPTAVTSNKKIAPARRHRLRTITLWLLVAIVALVVGLHIYNRQAVKTDRARFVQAQQDVSDLSRDIITATGQPLKVTNNKYCSRPHLEFQTGPLSCDVETIHFYGVNEPAEATAIFNEISSVVQQKWHRTGMKYSNNMTQVPLFKPIVAMNNKLSDYQQIYETYDNSNGIDCSAVYDLYERNEPPFGNYFVDQDHTLILAVNIDCSSYAKISYYPIAD